MDTTKKERIQDLLRDGKNTDKILEAVPGTKRYEIHNVRYRMKIKMARKSVPEQSKKNDKKKFKQSKKHVAEKAQTETPKSAPKENISAAERIRRLIAEGKTNYEILNSVTGILGQDVYQQRYNMKKYKGATEVAKTVVTKTAKPLLSMPPLSVPAPKSQGKEIVIHPWDAINAWGLGFFSGNVIKYVARHRYRNGVDDLKKAKYYLEKLIQLMLKEKST